MLISKFGALNCSNLHSAGRCLASRLGKPPTPDASQTAGGEEVGPFQCRLMFDSSSFYHDDQSSEACQVSGWEGSERGEGVLWLDKVRFGSAGLLEGGEQL